ncbi:hypothetical protein Caci_5048 [Catenulispora acidiphila DSM 44928]|uniref:PknH-like extracellular domain-containing protein n=1 Tax=Catenulispora acidiphila (strain DSM 44928 / JCM 14897 / NBRC 102108 / NRRL B-24433 / ID139908) TaxID=479433 RepID=C7Q4W0_CATAD|nr:hypothetical protein [Catenulispora acidiphila]ACU73908.1 hypothetical protein Caci_5048 [Catenulispora acidiphila DSM 44928]
MNEITKTVRPLVLATALAVGLGLAAAGCGGHASQSSAAAAGSSSAASPSTTSPSTSSVDGALTTAGSTPTASTTSTVPTTSGTSSQATSIPTTPPSTSARPSTSPATQPKPPTHPTTPPPAPIGSPPSNAAPAWLADPGGAYGWQQSEATHPVSWDLTSNESICYGLNKAAQIEEQGFRATHRTATARMQTFRYADAAAATTAYDNGLKQMGSCQDQLRAQQGRSAARVPQDATVAVTASDADGHAWSAKWTGVATPMSAAGHQVDRVYLVLQGSTVTLLETDDLGAGTPATDDPAVLSALGR